MESLTELRPRTTGTNSLESEIRVPSIPPSIDTSWLAHVDHAFEVVKRRGLVNGVGQERDESSRTVTAEQVNGPHQESVSSTPNHVKAVNSTLQNSMNEKSGPTIFFTYLREPSALDDIKDMETTLKKHGVITRTDEKEKKILTMNINHWLNETFSKSKYIMVCVSKQYNSIIASGQIDQSDQKQIQANFIFNQLQTEYMSGGCLNYRVLPILVGGATLKDVPLFLQNTTVYAWPKDYRELMDRIFDRQKYSAPERGKPPTMTFDACRP